VFKHHLAAVDGPHSIYRFANHLDHSLRKRRLRGSWKWTGLWRMGTSSLRLSGHIVHYPLRSSCFESTRWVERFCSTTGGRGHVRRLCQISRRRSSGMGGLITAWGPLHLALVQQAIYVLTTPPTLEPREARYDGNGTPIAAVFDGLGATHQYHS
jgi:hypothetical protein